MCRCDADGPVAAYEPTWSPPEVDDSAAFPTRRQALQQALQDTPVGALLVAAPLQRHGSSGTPRFPRATAALQRSLEARLARCSSLGLLPRILGPPTTLAHSRTQQLEEPELWEAVGVPPLGGSSSKVPPAVQAAAALQSVLDEEMGGWRNTFG